MTARAWTSLSIAALAACAADPVAPEPDHLAQRKAAMRAFWLEATFFYEDGECAYLPAGETERRPFACGSVLVGLVEGVTDAEVAEIVEAMAGGFTERAGRDPYAWIIVDVPVGTERDACLVALSDPRTRYCHLNITGPVSLN